MKKFIMIFILLFAIFSCGGSDENVKEENSSNIEKTDVKTENQENNSKNSNNIQGERYGNETVGSTPTRVTTTPSPRPAAAAAPTTWPT